MIDDNDESIHVAGISNVYTNQVLYIAGSMVPETAVAPVCSKVNDIHNVWYFTVCMVGTAGPTHGQLCSKNLCKL